MIIRTVSVLQTIVNRNGKNAESQNVQSIFVILTFLLFILNASQEV